MFDSLWKVLVSKKTKRGLEVVGQSKKDYFDSVNYVRTVTGLRHVLACPEDIKANTDQEVTFRGLPFGASIREAKRLLGRPEFHIDQEQEVAGHEVLFYFSTIGSVRVKQCFHFLHGKFFMGQSIVKTPNKEKRNAVVESVLEKYNLLPEEKGIANLEGFFPVCDSAGNRIEMRYAFELTITYVTGDPEVQPMKVRTSSGARDRVALLNAFRKQVVQYV